MMREVLSARAGATSAIGQGNPAFKIALAAPHKPGNRLVCARRIGLVIGSIRRLSRTHRVTAARLGATAVPQSRRTARYAFNGCLKGASVVRSGIRRRPATVLRHQ